MALTVDPVLNTGDPQQMNGYSYSENSPVTLSDPTGLVAVDERGNYDKETTNSVGKARANTSYSGTAKNRGRSRSHTSRIPSTSTNRNHRPRLSGGGSWNDPSARAERAQKDKLLHYDPSDNRREFFGALIDLTLFATVDPRVATNLPQDALSACWPWGRSRR